MRPGHGTIACRPLSTGCRERSGWDRPRLLLIGRVDRVEFAQQSRSFELGWFITDAGGTVRGGADDSVVNRVEGGP